MPGRGDRAGDGAGHGVEEALVHAGVHAGVHGRDMQPLGTVRGASNGSAQNRRGTPHACSWPAAEGAGGRVSGGLSTPVFTTRTEDTGGGGPERLRQRGSQVPEHSPPGGPPQRGAEALMGEGRPRAAGPFAVSKLGPHGT